MLLVSSIGGLYLHYSTIDTKECAIAFIHTNNWTMSELHDENYNDFGPDWTFWLLIAILHTIHFIAFLLSSFDSKFFQDAKKGKNKIAVFIGIIITLPLLPLMLAIFAAVLFAGAIIYIPLCICAGLGHGGGGGGNVNSRFPMIPMTTTTTQNTYRPSYSYFSNYQGSFVRDNWTGNVRPLWT
jgi:hypothetical protein